MPKKEWWKRILVYLCITFFFLTLVFVYMSFRSKLQAGLIEVGCSASLFIIFLHILKKVIPQSSGTIITVLSILMAVILVYANYSFQKSKHNEYTFKEFLVGDLLTQRLVGKHKEKPGKLLTKKFKDIIPGEFIQTKTEKHTIESSFEKPEKDLMGEPVALPLDEPDSISIRQEKVHFFYIPKETMNYKVEFAKKEGLKLDRAKILAEIIEDGFDEINEKFSGRHMLAPMHLPLELEVGPNRLFRAIHSKSEISADMSELEMQPALTEEHVGNEPVKQVEEKLQIP